MPPHVLIVVGYYDTFSGYQEVNLARGFAALGATVTVIAGDRVAPIFSDAAILSLGLKRYYPLGEGQDGRVQVVRVGYRKISSLLISGSLVCEMRGRRPDVVLTLGVGQGFSAPSAWITSARRATIFGDNRAQWVGLSPMKNTMKRLTFAATKGVLYRLVMRRCDRVYVNTPNTRDRIHSFAGSSELLLLPLCVDTKVFHPDDQDRITKRAELGVGNETIIAMLGKVSREKRVDVLLDVLEEIDDPSVVLVISGLGNDTYSLSVRDRVSASQSLSQRVRLLGYIPAHELASLMRAADICIWPVQPAITIQQAMVTGCRVVLPDNDLAGFLVSDALQGGTFHEGDFTMLKKVIVEQTAIDDDSDARVSRAELNSGLGSISTARRLLEDLGWTSNREWEQFVTGPA